MEKNKKMDLVYILGTGSRWRNNEIRYSLRSVQKHMDIGRVFIVGECPEWITGVVHVPAKDMEKNKQLNARHKYEVAARDKRISKDFILMNDDFFILKPVSEVEYYIRGTIDEMIQRHPTKGGYYYRSLCDTKRVLESMGIDDPQDFEIHSPIIFNKDKLLMTMNMIPADKAYSLRSCYGNLNEIKGKKVIDFKAAGIVDWAYQKKRSPAYLSISDALVAQKEFRDWLRFKFRHPSKYETDRGAGEDMLPWATMGSLRFYAKQSFTYAGKMYSKGEILDPEMMDELRNSSKMRNCWELK